MSGKALKEAASVIIASRRLPTLVQNRASPASNAPKVTGEDYEVLMLRRSSKTSFMPSACVFPGGGYDGADCSSFWLQLFNKCGLQNSLLQKQFSLSERETPAVYQRLRLKNESNSSSTSESDTPLMPEIALRLTALRETFEEAGLLLAVPVENGSFGPPLAITQEKTFAINSAEDLGAKYSSLGGKSLENWRSEIQSDPGKFAEMFASTNSKSSSLLPWCWGLVEWWSWLTPQNYSARRFDTIFYTALLPHTTLSESLLSCCRESDSLKVLPPSDVVQSWLQEKIWLAPPQVYEFGRLLQYDTLTDLQQQVQDRQDNSSCSVATPVDTFLPQMFKCTDGLVSFLDDDRLYDSRYTTQPGETPELPLTMEELRRLPNIPPHVDGAPASDINLSLDDSSDSAALNRMEITGAFYCCSIVTVPSKWGQVEPLNLMPSSS